MSQSFASSGQSSEKSISALWTLWLVPPHHPAFPGGREQRVATQSSSRWCTHRQGLADAEAPMGAGVLNREDQPAALGTYASSSPIQTRWQLVAWRLDSVQA